VSAPLLAVQALNVSYAIDRRTLRALTDVSFDVAGAETLGVVGESGSGKSTLARAILRLVHIASGRIHWQGLDWLQQNARDLRRLRRDVQIVFQDPFASLDPRMTLGAAVSEPLEIFRPELASAECERAVARVLERVGLGAQIMNRYPHELSGGQCQRAAIARAIVLKPQLLVCDEPVSALDVSIQAQIVNLLRELQAELGMSMIFISHNLAVVRRISDRALVLYLGRTMELATRDALFKTPRHPYTRALLDSVPAPSVRPKPGGVRLVASETPAPLNPPSGCVFHTRCPFTIDRCRQEVPRFEEAGPGHQVACHRWRELPARD
jgi:oligopeptide transport system ATP-binding protein